MGFSGRRADGDVDADHGCGRVAAVLRVFAAPAGVQLHGSEGLPRGVSTHILCDMCDVCDVCDM